MDDDWELNDQGFPRRSLLTVQLIDVAPVNMPAYEATSAGVRSLDRVDVALRSLAAKMQADMEEVRSLARADELRKFFVRTDGGAPKPPAKRLFGPAAAAALMAKKEDPWV